MIFYSIAALPVCSGIWAFGQMASKVDALAEKMGQSRAAVINMAVYRVVEHG